METKQIVKPRGNEEKMAECLGILLPVRDALEVLNGKWKLPIIISLSFGDKRFRQIGKDINGITDKMLSKELKDLEMNKLIKRTIYHTFPPTVEYSITDHGRSLKKLINELRSWGDEHRKKIIGTPKPPKGGVTKKTNSV